MRRFRACAILCLLAAGVHGEGPAWRSRLFPADWTPGHRDGAGRALHDFSFAGYRNGEAPLPALAQARRFKVVADATGAADAGPAIQAAIDAAERAGGGVVVVPPGLYRVDDLLTVKAK